MSNPNMKKSFREADRESRRLDYLIHSLHAKLMRVEPEGDEYWHTLERLEAAIEEKNG